MTRVAIWARTKLPRVMNVDCLDTGPEAIQEARMPEIRETNDIVTQITTVKVPPDHQSEVLQLMEERARYMATQPGFVSVSLHRSEDGSHVVNYVQWNQPKEARGRTPIG
jgi:hypothetical protein